MVTVRPEESTTLPPEATFSAEMVVSAVTTQVEVPSTFTLIGALEADDEPEIAAEFSVISAEPVHEEPSSRLSVTVEMVSALTLPDRSCERPVKFTVAPFEPADPQLFESFPAAKMRSAAEESKSSLVFCSTTSAVALVK